MYSMIMTSDADASNKANEPEQMFRSMFNQGDGNEFIRKDELVKTAISEIGSARVIMER